ncbi:hypothetical protein GGR57DRAFT_357708 [Xylariaceae sp. FL1272]|nr:hypothetical protein GGR57DRAFT_357708 [Xylariaceae sp. FL1272]
MRVSSLPVLLAMPLLAVADTPQDYLAQARVYFDKFASKIPSPSKFDPVAAAAAKVGASKMDILGLHNWKETLHGSVAPGSTKPEEWWVLITGGNKTCFGHCDRVEAAFNETAGKFALDPTAPHAALVNCDDQPVLCNSWSAPVGSLWIFEMLPEPAAIDVYSKRFNLTTVTSDDFTQLRGDGYKTEAKRHEGFFHPFNGPLAQNGLAVPAGYVLWAFSLLPSWAFMILISMFSRRMMSSRMEGQMHGGPRPAATGQAAPR